MIRKTALAMLLVAPVLLAACNTVEGLGRDVSAAGNAIADAAN